MNRRPASAPADVTATIVEAGVVAVLRASTAEHVPAVARELVDAGIRIIEVTLTTPGAVTLIEELHRSLEPAVLIGAGTVVTADEAEACINADADFVVSPAASLDVIATAQNSGIAAFPGALTPTEIIAAHRAGASAVKLFPASAVGPGYLKDIRGPFPDIPIMPTGGISVTDVESWLRAGAAAVGLGAALYGTSCESGVDAGLRDRALRALKGVAAARGGA